MKCKIEKYVYTKSADVFIKNFRCNAYRITNLISLLKCHYAVLLLDDFIEKGDIFKLFDEYQISHHSFQNKSHYGLLALIPAENLSAILRTIMKNGISNMFLFNLRDDSCWIKCCECINVLNPNFLIKSEMSSMTIGIDFDENYAGLHFALDSYNVNDVVEYIKCFI